MTWTTQVPEVRKSHQVIYKVGVKFNGATHWGSAIVTNMKTDDAPTLDGKFEGVFETDVVFWLKENHGLIIPQIESAYSNGMNMKDLEQHRQQGNNVVLMFGPIVDEYRNDEQWAAALQKIWA